MSEIKNVIVIGAGGNLGPTIVNALLKQSSFNVTILSRQESTSTFPDGVKVIRADYNSADALKDAFKGQDAVVSLVGGMALGDQNKFIDAAIAAGVKRFLPSEYGSNTINPEVLAKVPIFQGKVGTVEYLKSKESEISWTSIITGAFFDWGLKVGFLGPNLATKKAAVVDNGKGRFSVTNLATIGLAVVKSLEKASETKNKYVYISSFQTTQAELVAALEKASGDKYEVESTSHTDMVAKGTELLSKGDFSGIPLQLQGMGFGEHNLGDLSPEGLWNDKLGLPKENLEDSVKAVLAGQ